MHSSDVTASPATSETIYEEILTTSSSVSDGRDKRGPWRHIDNNKARLGQPTTSQAQEVYACNIQQEKQRRRSEPRKQRLIDLAAERPSSSVDINTDASEWRQRAVSTSAAEVDARGFMAGRRSSSASDMAALLRSSRNGSMTTPVIARCTELGATRSWTLSSGDSRSEGGVVLPERNNSSCKRLPPSSLPLWNNYNNSSSSSAGGALAGTSGRRSLLVRDKTEYSEIVSSISATEVTTGRPTRESENPILRVQVLSSPSSSLGSDNSHSSVDFTRSTAEATASCSTSVARGLRSGNVYENVSSTNQLNEDTTIYENMNCGESEIRAGRTGVYENTRSEPCARRNRSSSKPIDILASPHQDGEVDNGELLYSDLDFGLHDNNQIDSSSVSSHSSPGCSSVSSGCLSSMSSSHGPTAPAPPPRPKNGVHSLTRRPVSQSWSNCTVIGLSFFKALYLGSFNISRPCSSHVDSVIKDATHKINVTDTVSILVDVNNEVLRFGTCSSPWELITSFSVDDIHAVEIYSKDCRLMGLVSSQPGHEAYCHVLQSEDATLIVDAVREVFKSQPKVGWAAICGALLSK